MTVSYMTGSLAMRLLLGVADVGGGADEVLTDFASVSILV